MRWIFFIAFCLFLSFQVLAQDNNVFLPEMEAYLNETDILSGNSFIKQAGNGNSIVTIQQSQQEQNNIINAQQLAHNNEAYIKQIGSANAAFLVQRGNGNEANVWQIGDYSFNYILQHGNNNTVNSYINNQGILFKSATLIQDGNNNNIELALTGNGYLAQGYPKAAYIQQSGNNLEVIAKLDSYDSPILIRQQSGSSDKGMKVKVTNTDFYFPAK